MVKVVGMGTSNNVVCPCRMNSRKTRNIITNVSSSRGLVVIMGIKYNVETVVVRMDGRGSNGLLARHTFIVWNMNVKVVGKNIRMASTGRPVRVH